MGGVYIYFAILKKSCRAAPLAGALHFQGGVAAGSAAVQEKCYINQELDGFKECARC